ncbi:MAG: hypothetical protein ACXWT0_10655 [Methylobacter sp.]
MQLSAEVRWFWPNEPPSGLQAWFCHADSQWCAAGGGEARVDEYLCDPYQRELGLKRRGGKSGVEIKGLVAVTWGGLLISPFTGPIEIWAKWTSERLELQSNSTVSTTKLRYLRKFDTTFAFPEEIPLGTDERPLDKQRQLPNIGCNVELTQVTFANGKIWWTLGFEAFGTIRTIENDLRAVATILASRQPPILHGGLQASYPAWLKKQINEM